MRPYNSDSALNSRWRLWVELQSTNGQDNQRERRKSGEHFRRSSPGASRGGAPVHVSRSRHRHLLGEGGPHGRPPAGDRQRNRRSRGLAAPSRLVRAGPGKLVARLRDRARRARGHAQDRARRRQGHRPLRPHARRHADRCVRPAAAPLHPVERRALGRRGRGTRPQPDLPQDHRQHRLPGLHRAEAGLGRQARAGHLRQGRQGAAAQGLRAAEADRRPCLRHVGFRRDILARRRQARLERRAARGHEAVAVADAEALRRFGADRAPPRRTGAALGHERGRDRCRWRRRQCGLGLRRRRGQAGHGLRLARHLGRAVRLQRALLARSRDRGPRLLPRRARHLAPDGRHPVGRRRARVAGGRVRRERRRH